MRLCVLLSLFEEERPPSRGDNEGLVSPREKGRIPPLGLFLEGGGTDAEYMGASHKIPLAQTALMCVLLEEVFPDMPLAQTAFMCVLLEEVFPYIPLAQTALMCVLLEEVFPYIPLAQIALMCVLLEEVFPNGGESQLHDDLRVVSRGPHPVCNAGGMC